MSLRTIPAGPRVRARPSSPGLESEARRKKRAVRLATPLQRFRKQTTKRRDELRKIIKESNKELRAIVKDLGKLKRQ